MSHEKEIHRESNVKIGRIVNLLDLLLGELELQCLDVALEVLNLATTDDRKDIRGLVPDVFVRTASLCR